MNGNYYSVLEGDGAEDEVIEDNDVDNKGKYLAVNWSGFVNL